MNLSSTSAPVDAFILKEEEIIQKKKCGIICVVNYFVTVQKC